ncbi:MAG: serine/threonine-protein phosphatase [Bernardetiaceae bacterium]|nr:serine/threonine-protein phosphatase [Bernardetiaceae bacterium]
MPISAEDKLRLLEIELESLFGIIQSINDNAAEEDLYRIYKFTVIHPNSKINKIALFVRDKDWAVKITHRTTHDYTKIGLDNQILKFNKTVYKKDFENVDYFSEFDIIIPVKHKENILAYVFIGRPPELQEAEELNINFISVLSNIVIVAIENKKLARKQKAQEALKQQMEIARDVQTLLFPKKLPQSPRLQVEASYKPHHNVGGDYYDFIKMQGEKFLVCVADVSGKGVPAAILMSNFQAALRSLLRHTEDLKHIVEELNHLIMENGGGDNFITAFFLIYDMSNGKAQYVNAGHNPPILIEKQGHKHRELNKGTTIIGAFEPLPFLEIGTLEDLNEFLLFCFTDGFTETINDKGEEFGEEALAQYVIENSKIDQKTLHKKLFEMLDSFKQSNSFADDITLLSCKIDRFAAKELS